MDPNSRLIMLGSGGPPVDTGNSTPATLVTSILLPGSTTTYNPNKQTGDLVVVCFHYWQNTEPPGFTLFQQITVGYYPGRVYYRVVQPGDTSYDFSNTGGYGFYLAVVRGHTLIKEAVGFGSLESGAQASRSFTKDGSIIVFAADRGATSAPTLSISGGFDYFDGPNNSGAFIEIGRIKLDYNANTSVTLTDTADTWSSGAIMVLTN